MSEEDRFAEERKRNRVVYAVEDFYDAIGDLRYVWLGNVALASFIGIGLVFGADNTMHIIAALLTAVGVYAAQQYVTLSKWTNLLAVVTLYLLGIGVELVVAGLPEPLIPFLTVEEGWVGFVPFLNSASPGLYFGVRLALAYALVNLCLRRQTLGKQPLTTLRQVDRELAMQLE